jgi:hypothetical protein
LANYIPVGAVLTVALVDPPSVLVVGVFVAFAMANPVYVVDVLPAACCPREVPCADSVDPISNEGSVLFADDRATFDLVVLRGLD